MKKLFFFILVAAMTLNLHADDAKSNKLKFYCAVNLKIPFEKTVAQYTKEYKTEFTGDFKSTGHLLGTVKLHPAGDVFISADSSTMDAMKKDGLVREVLPLSESYPVIIVQKGNPKNIKDLNDFKRADVRVVLSNPDSAAIGKLTHKIFTELGEWDVVAKNTKDNGVFKPTVTEMANDIKMKVADVTIVWDSTAKQKAYANDFDVIELDVLKKYKDRAMIGILASCENPTKALHFARYLHAIDKGQKNFEAEGFSIITDADTWADKPEISVFSGSMNRIAIDKAMKAFQEREGIVINTVYNGCGVLVGQMKAGGKPDAYFSCDETFMDMVKDRFQPAENLTEADILIVVRKGNPLNIKTLEDLTKPGIRIAMAHPIQSTLGALTKEILENHKIYDEVSKNVVSQTPTADMIIAQFKAASLDVALVYTSTIAYVKDEVTAITIPDKRATARQSYAIANITKNHYLLQRLLATIKDDTTKFTNVGFRYIGSKF